MPSKKNRKKGKRGGGKSAPGGAGGDAKAESSATVEDVWGSVVDAPGADGKTEEGAAEVGGAAEIEPSPAAGDDAAPAPEAEAAESSAAATAAADASETAAGFDPFAPSTEAPAVVDGTGDAEGGSGGGDGEAAVTEEGGSADDDADAKADDALADEAEAAAIEERDTSAVDDGQEGVELTELALDEDAGDAHAATGAYDEEGGFRFHDAGVEDSLMAVIIGIGIIVEPYVEPYVMTYADDLLDNDDDTPSNADPEAHFDLSFIVVGDWGRANDAAKATAAGMATWASQNDASFVISTGDNFYSYGITGTDDPLVRTLWYDVYVRDAGLTIPWYPTLGNHDERGNFEAQIALSQEYPLWRFPSTSFNFTKSVGGECLAHFTNFRSAPFIGEYWGQSAHEVELYGHSVQQSDNASIAAFTRHSVNWGHHECRWNFAAAHHPLYSGAEHGDLPDMIQTFRHSFHRGLQDGGFFCGHDHDLQHIRRDGDDFDQFLSGGGSDIRAGVHPVDGTLFAAATNGFLGVRLNHTHAEYSFVGTQAETLYRVVREHSNHDDHDH